MLHSKRLYNLEFIISDFESWAMSNFVQVDIKVQNLTPTVNGQPGYRQPLAIPSSSALNMDRFVDLSQMDWKLCMYIVAHFVDLSQNQ